MPNIKSFHHLRFSSSEPHIVFGRLEAGSPEIRYDLHRSKTTAFPGQSKVISFPGLDIKCQRYLLEHIREYCDDSCKDIVCPKPSANDSGMVAVGSAESGKQSATMSQLNIPEDKQTKSVTGKVSRESKSTSAPVTSKSPK